MRFVLKMVFHEIVGHRLEVHLICYANTALKLQ